MCGPRTSTSGHMQQQFLGLLDCNSACTEPYMKQISRDGGCLFRMSKVLPDVVEGTYRVAHAVAQAMSKAQSVGCVPFNQEFPLFTNVHSAQFLAVHLAKSEALTKTIYQLGSSQASMRSHQAYVATRSSANAIGTFMPPLRQLCTTAWPPRPHHLALQYSFM